ncbi:MAG TPA: putative Ig domain-containing protein, partial [Candidatus Ozemobacteraceae bacterium]|nr:putative Ig domain-containing protein [Candidatus Ozemobacteraceae bacterium]
GLLSGGKGVVMGIRGRGMSRIVFFLAALLAAMTFHGCGGGGSSSRLASVQISGLSADGSADGSGLATEAIPLAAPAVASEPDPLRLYAPAAIHAAQNIYSYFKLEAVDGVPPYTFTASGLPEGFGLGTSTGFVGGTPVATGVATITFTVTDASGTAFSAFSVMTIVPGLSISCLTQMHFTFDQQVSTLFAVPLAGRAPYEFTVTGLPPGLDLRVDRNRLAYLMGAPDRLGSHSVTLFVKDADGAEAQADVVISVSRAGYWVETGVAYLRVGDTFNQLICQARGGSPLTGIYGTKTYEYAVSGLPPGIALVTYAEGAVDGSNQFGALVSGTATTVGNYVIDITAVDTTGAPVKGMGFIQVDPKKE